MHGNEAMMVEFSHPWGSSDHVVTYFNGAKKAMKQLAKANIGLNNNEKHDRVLIAVKKCPDFDKIINEWDEKILMTRLGRNSRPSSPLSMQSSNSKQMRGVQKPCDLEFLPLPWK